MANVPTGFDSGTPAPTGTTPSATPPLPGAGVSPSPAPVLPAVTQVTSKPAVPSWWSSQQTILGAVWGEYTANGYESANELLIFAKIVLDAMKNRER